MAPSGESTPTSPVEGGRVDWQKCRFRNVFGKICKQFTSVYWDRYWDGYIDVCIYILYIYSGCKCYCWWDAWLALVILLNLVLVSSDLGFDGLLIRWSSCLSENHGTIDTKRLNLTEGHTPISTDIKIDWLKWWQLDLNYVDTVYPELTCVSNIFNRFFFNNRFLLLH